MSALLRPTTPAPVGPAANAPSGQNYTPAPASTVRRPRGFLIISGKKIPLLSLNTQSVTHFSADAWDATTGLTSPFDIAYWDAIAPGTVVSVCYGFLTNSQPANALPSEYSVVVTGLIDSIEPNLLDGTVDLHGRSLQARLIDAKTANLYANQTASAAVTQIAKQFGFTPQVTPTKTAIGRYSNNVYSAPSGATAYWDLIRSWAAAEGFEAYVTGTTLVFGPSPADNDSQKFVYYWETDGKGRNWSNAKSVSYFRNANLSKDITINVISHNMKTGKSLRYVASRAGVRVPSSSRSNNPDDVVNYTFRKPGLDAAQAQNWAQAKLKELSAWEKEVTIEVEGSPDMATRKQIVTRGTGTSWDGAYYIVHISRRWSAQSGFTMQIRARSAPPADGEDGDE